jgi:hypothetical protein
MKTSTLVDSSDWGMSESVKLADENFNSPNSFDIVLGLMCSFNLVAMISRRRSEIIQFYWEDNLTASEGLTSKSFFIQNNDILEQLQRFWEIRKFSNMSWVTEELLCERHF